MNDDLFVALGISFSRRFVNILLTSEYLDEVSDGWFAKKKNLQSFTFIRTVNKCFQ